MTQYDIITVGGGLGGASLAKAMAERGYRVLVIFLSVGEEFGADALGEQMVRGSRQVAGDSICSGLAVQWKILGELR